MSILISCTDPKTEKTVQKTAAKAPEAFAAVRDFAKDAKADAPLSVTVAFDGGTYPIDAPITLDGDADEGLRYISLTVSSETGASLSGLRALPASAFRKAEGKPYYVCQMEKDGEEYPAFEDLFADGARLPMARSACFISPFDFENRDKEDPVNHIGVYAPEDLLAPFRTEKTDPAQMEMYIEWTHKSVRMESVDFSDVREKDGVRYVRVHFHGDAMTYLNGFNGFLTLANREMFILNHPAFLTPGSFCYDAYTGILTYYPDGALEEKALGYTTLENLLTVKRMDRVTFRNIAFTGTTTGYRIKNSYFSGQANNESRVRRLPHAPVVTYSMRHTLFDNCRFTESGGNGLLMKDSNIAVTVKNCIFRHIGMNALSIGNPTWEWKDPENRNIGITVENNLFEDIAYTYPAALAVYIGMVDRLSLCHNTIRRCAYSGISVGWSWSRTERSLGESVNIREADIAYNYIEDFMMLLRDGAAVYVLGGNVDPSDDRLFNAMHDNYATRPLFRDSSKRGYYMDGSSSNWDCYHNVICGVRLPIFSQFHVPSQYTFHNHIDDIYTDFPVDRGNHAPWRDTLLQRYYDDARSEEELLAKYPEAVRIRDAAGCRLD